MKIKKGDTLEEITLPKADGKMFDLSETKGKKVLLTFYRVAGCTFCNLRLMELNKRFNELGKNFVHVGIFHSPIDLLNSNMSKHKTISFTILAEIRSCVPLHIHPIILFSLSNLLMKLIIFLFCLTFSIALTPPGIIKRL